MDFWLDDSGQGTLEYGLVVGLIAMIAVGVLLVFGSDTNASLQNSSNSINDPNSVAPPTHGQPLSP